MARTIACPAWVNLSADMPNGGTSEAAELGTALHDAMEWLMGDLARLPDDCMGTTFNGIKITYDHINDKIMPAYDELDQLRLDYGIKNFVLEPFVELIPGLAGGSIDFLGVSADGKTVVVVDYKFGYNLVSPEENAQLMFYALCADADPATNDMFKHVETLVLAIIQPNDQGIDDMRTYTCPVSDLDAFEDTVAAAVKQAEDGCDKPVSGPHCKFCPAESVCPVKTGLARKAQMLPAVQLFNLGEYLPMVDELEAWIKAVKKLAHETLEAGQKVPGYKLVDKRASRVWTDPDAAAKKIKAMRGIAYHDDACDIKLKSPAQMEKAFKAKKVDFKKVGDYITSMSSGTTMAKASDKRPEAISVEAYRAAMQRLPE
jgi:hypothetical protein